MERNFEIAVVLFESGRALQRWGKLEESLKKYQEVKVLMERNDMKCVPIYDTILENIKVIEAAEKE